MYGRTIRRVFVLLCVASVVSVMVLSLVLNTNTQDWGNPHPAAPRIREHLDVVVDVPVVGGQAEGRVAGVGGSRGLWVDVAVSRASGLAFIMLTAVMFVFAGVWIGSVVGTALQPIDQVGGGSSLARWVKRRWLRWIQNSGFDDDADRLFRDAADQCVVDPNDVIDSVWGGAEKVVNHYPRYARMVAAEIKLQHPYHTLLRTTADLLSVQAAARTIMERDKLRLSHRVVAMPLIVALVFSPSKEEITLQRILQSGGADDVALAFAQATADHVLDKWTGGSRRAHFSRT